MDLSLLNREFHIKPYDRESVYIAVGKIIENAQKFEKEYKDCLLKNNIKLKKKKNDSLFDCNKKMLKKGLLTFSQQDILAKIAVIRNEVNHSFFIDKMSAGKTEEDWADIDNYLNVAMALIFEGRDIISNIMKRNDELYVPARTIFDKFFNKKK